jgi:hypothetical protein
VDYSQRRGWIRQLQEQLAALFAVEVEFHVEMSNHLHLVVVPSGTVASAVAGSWMKRRS